MSYQRKVVVVHIYPSVSDCVRHKLVDDPRIFHCGKYFMMGGILTCLAVSSDLTLFWISLTSCQLNLLQLEATKQRLLS